MSFSIATITGQVKAVKALAAKAKNVDSGLLDTYAEYDINASGNAAKGERGIVVLSLDGGEPILAQTEEYYTSDGVVENMKVAGKGLAGIAGQYQAEQAQLARLNKESQNINFDVVFDAESPNEEN